MSEEKLVEALRLFVDALDNAVQVLRKELGSAGLSEEAFNILKWELQKGDRLSEFEVANKKNNFVDKWQHACNILRQNNATLANHFGDKAWTYYYWLYDKSPDTIFRKRRT